MPAEISLDVLALEINASKEQFSVLKKSLQDKLRSLVPLLSPQSVLNALDSAKKSKNSETRTMWARLDDWNDDYKENRSGQYTTLGGFSILGVFGFSAFIQKQSLERYTLRISIENPFFSSEKFYKDFDGKEIKQVYESAREMDIEDMHRLEKAIHH